jgi:phosphoglycerate dehydrogenase-like enzyme
MLSSISDRVEIVNHEMSEADLDRWDASSYEILLAPRGPRPLARMPRLRWVQIDSVGVDHLIDDPIFRGEVTVTNARGVYSTSIAEYAMWAILDYNQKGPARRRRQAEKVWLDGDSTVAGKSLRGQTVLIVGYGTIGRETARLATSFGMHVLAVKARSELRHDTSFCPAGTGDPDGVLPDLLGGIDALRNFAAKADVLINTLPLTRQSRGIISAEVINALPNRAVLVNVGRGATIDEAALLEALSEGRLGAACIDVFSQEPLPSHHPLWADPGVTITTHVSGVDQNHYVLYQLFAENLRRYLTDRPLLNVVSAARGY